MPLPIIINGRIGHPDEWDVFQFTGRAGQTVVAEVWARRLGSPLDSVLKLTDAAGKVLAYNDDFEDPAAGTNTHNADSYLSFKLPADGTYYLHLGDAARNGGEEYGYRLHIGPPQPDFVLFAFPSSISLRGKAAAAVSVYIIRKDGFSGPVKLGLKDPPPGFSAAPVSLSAAQKTAQLSVKTSLSETKQPLRLTIEGRATIGGREVVHTAVPAEDRMQAFLWRHLVPANDMPVVVFSPSYQPPKRARRTPLPPPPPEPKPQAASAATPAAKPQAGSASTPAAKPQTASAATPAAKPKFTKQQAAYHVRLINLLFDEGLLTEEFSARKLAESEAAR